MPVYVSITGPPAFPVLLYISSIIENTKSVKPSEIGLLLLPDPPTTLTPLFIVISTTAFGTDDTAAILKACLINAFAEDFSIDGTAPTTVTAPATPEIEASHQSISFIASIG